MSAISDQLTGKLTEKPMLGKLSSLTGGGGLTGGSSGPANAGGTTNSSSSTGFTGGVVNMGSNNGIPMWAIVAALVLVAVYVFKRK